MASFKTKHSFENRLKEGNRILSKYPDKLPVICERSKSEKVIADIDKHKYLIPVELTLGQFIYVIRKRLNLGPNHALFLLIEGNSPSHSTLMSELYSKYKSNDQYLYITYAAENTFG
jgi:GABA(A) receptor-associated protein